MLRVSIRRSRLLGVLACSELASRFFVAFASCIVSLLGEAEIGSAQVLPGRSRIDRPELPDFPSDRNDSRTPAFELPPAYQNNAPHAEPLDDGAIAIQVNGFRFSGNSVFSAAQLSELTGLPVGSRATASQLQGMAHKITRHYVALGYVNSRAELPDQDVEDGIVHFRIVEGVLADVELSGLRSMNRSRLRAQLMYRMRGPLNIGRLEETLQILRRSTLIDRIHASLSTRDAPDRAVLLLRVEEASPWSASASYSNHQDPSIGSHGGIVELVGSTLSGWTDEAAIQFRGTEGLIDIQGRYWIELNSVGTRLAARGRFARSEVVQNPFEVLSIESETRMFEVGLIQPILTNRTDAIDLGIQFDHQASESTILNLPLPSEFASEGRTRINAFRLTQNWTHSAPTDVFGFYSTISIGTDWLDGTKNSPGIADSRFVSWLGQIQYAHRFPWRDTRLLGRCDVQLANDPLLPLERYSAGGAASVRGYQENHVVRDNAFVGSVEVHIPILGRSGQATWAGLAPFVDYGRAWNHGGPAWETDDLVSVGVGLVGRMFERFDFEVYWGRDLKRVPVAGGDSVQDSGVSMRFRMEYR